MATAAVEEKVKQIIVEQLQVDEAEVTRVYLNAATRVDAEASNQL